MRRPSKGSKEMIAIIPARGGSKGLTGKNTRLLGGKPLIAWTIEAALGASSLSRIILSTDNEEIANIGLEYGAEVPFMRPTELAQDNSLAIDTYTYTVDRLNNEIISEGKSSFPLLIDELAVCLPTAPLRESADIDNSVRIFREQKADSVISFYQSPHPLQWYKCIDENGVLRGVFSEREELANRQEEKLAYLPNGAIYIFKYSLLKEKRTYYTDKTYPYLMPVSRSVDIDTFEDFCLAEFYLSLRERQGRK